MAKKADNVSQLAFLFGLSEAAVYDLARSGVIPPLIDSSFDAPASIRAYIAHLKDDRYIVNATEIADILGMTPKGVHGLVRDGELPRERRGNYDLKKCVTAYIERLRKKAHGAERTSMEEEALLHKREQRLKAEIERKSMERDYIPREECEAGWQTLAGIAIAAIDAIPARAPSTLINCNTIAQMRDHLRKESRNARQQIADELSAITDQLRDPGG